MFGFWSRSRWAWLIGLAVVLSACATPSERRDPYDQIPMYGAPTEPRPAELRKADNAFIAAAMRKPGGREAVAKTYIEMGRRALESDDLPLAMRRYNQSWLLSIGNYETYWGFGQIMLRTGQPEKAADHFETAKRLVEDRRRRAVVLTDLGTAYSLKAAKMPADAHDAVADERARAFQLANEAFEEAAILDRSHGALWQAWAESCYREGRYADAWDKVRQGRGLGGVDYPRGFLEELARRMPEPR